MKMTLSEEKKRNSSVSYTPGKDDECEDSEIHVSLAPYIQTYLAHSQHGLACCGVNFPVPFERAAPRSWWNPKFDSDILEEQYKISSFSQLRSRFRYALSYILLISLSWLMYFIIRIMNGISNWSTTIIIFSAIIIIMSTVLYFTYTDYYRSYVISTSLAVATILCSLSLLLLVIVPPYNDGLTHIGHFALCSEILLLIYTVIPLPLYGCICLCSIYSILFEFFTGYFYATEDFFIKKASLNESNPTDNDINFGSTLTIRILMQLCIHVIGIHILIMTFVRMRGTFMKVGQSLLVRRQLEMEKQLKEKMIHSVMPPKVADWLMEESEREREREDSLKKGSIPSQNTDIRSLFRPFNMHSMNDVSILFADIVGFTRMSSNKTAEELVGILNDLFERFDDLCEHHECEKISTLGDCYYCVSGCPEPKSNHAKCCIEMGLEMIEAIKEFDNERREDVNMRVGVHTGTVLCGIVGTKRFKFDVWSNDVTFANKLESTGKPGRVHFSEKTLSFLGDQYLVEDGDTIKGIKTYFIKGRKIDLINQFMTTFTSPVNTPSLIPQINNRPRLSSCNNQSKSRQHYLHMITNTSNYRKKANSLPSILDSEDDEEMSINNRDDSSKSPSSIASYGKKKSRIRPWKFLQRQKTLDESIEKEKKYKSNEKITKCMETSEIYNGLNKISVVNDVETNPDPLPSSPLLADHDIFNRASSICSRKDSGIRSFSRRSSIQQQLFLMNGMAQGDLLTHRVSEYYTSNSTLSSTCESFYSAPPQPPHISPPMTTDTFGACFHKLRKQSDLQLIRCVQENVNAERSHFVEAPLSSVTLFFRNEEMEKEYRENVHRVTECIGDNPATLATARFNTYFDILISAIIYTVITTSLFLLCKLNPSFIIYYIVATTIQVFVVALCVRQLIEPNSIDATYTQIILKIITKWYPWHACGAVLVGLPIISILMNVTCGNIKSTLNNFEFCYSYLIFVSLVHFCNFTQLNCWMKNLLVTVAALLFIFIIGSHILNHESFLYGVNGYNADSNRTTIERANFKMNEFTTTSINRLPRDINDKLSPLSDINFDNNPIVPSNINENDDETLKPTIVTSSEPTTKKIDNELNQQIFYKIEIYLDIIILLVLVWFLNREFEIRYRLSFHSNAVAARDRTRVQAMKNQADWLLHNIIPKYVADQLKTTAKYSQNHKSVGIIFASIVNFNELYDESYLGGKEYLRVLNELIGDFDELLEKPEFCNVEKIKTIGSTFMAASGLNSQVRQQSDDEYDHLYQLVDFAVAMQKVIDDFNRDLLGFKLILRIGYNYGDVTAGVIGATKLYYDIWGDAVNIASRMDSTGVPGRIQLAKDCLDVLSVRYDFEPRGQVYVKGKDNMDVFLLIGKKI